MFITFFKSQEPYYWSKLYYLRVLCIICLGMYAHFRMCEYYGRYLFGGKLKKSKQTAFKFIFYLVCGIPICNGNFHSSQTSSSASFVLRDFRNNRVYCLTAPPTNRFKVYWSKICNFVLLNSIIIVKLISCSLPALPRGGLGWGSTFTLWTL